MITAAQHEALKTVLPQLKTLAAAHRSGQHLGGSLTIPPWLVTILPTLEQLAEDAIAAFIAANPQPAKPA